MTQCLYVAGWLAPRQTLVTTNHRHVAAQPFVTLAYFVLRA